MDLAVAREALRGRRQFNSDRRLADVAGIIDVKGPALDREYIERWAASLEVVDLWRRLSGTDLQG